MDSFSFTVAAPARVNLLGEHTDYNGLPVLPMAIERHITIQGKVISEVSIMASAIDYSGETVAFTPSSAIPPHPQGHWANYVKAGVQGVMELVSASGNLRGCEMEIRGDIPPNAGLSSSSALVVASALAFLTANQAVFDRIELAERMAWAEHYVGTRGGGMDQAASLLGRKGHVLKMDFFPLRVTPAPLPDEVTVVICHSGVEAKKSGEALRAYNLRAVECRLGVMLLRRQLRQMNQPSEFQRLGDLLNPPWSWTYEELLHFIETHLSDAYTYAELQHLLHPADMLQDLLQDYGFADEASAQDLSFACGKRFRHICTDGWRVEQSLEALEAGDAQRFAELINEGHASARDDFEISCPELERLVQTAQQNGALASRLTGAGFGGCTVHLVRTEEAGAFVERMKAQSHHPAALKTSPFILVTAPADGAEIQINS